MNDILRIEHLTKSFGAMAALDDVSTTVRAGEKICIIGPSGSGKSTLLRCISYLEQPASGDAWLDGSPVSHRIDASGRHRQPTENSINQLRKSVDSDVSEL